MYLSYSELRLEKPKHFQQQILNIIRCVQFIDRKQKHSITKQNYEEICDQFSLLEYTSVVSTE